MTSVISDPNLIESTHVASPRAKRLSETRGLAGSNVSYAGSARVRFPLETIVNSPEEALLAEEVIRNRNFALMSAVLTSAGLAFMPFIGGNENLRWVLLAGLGVCFIQSVWNWFSLRRPENFTAGRTLILALTALTTGFLAILFWGVFSAASSMVILGLYFFGRSTFTRSAYVVLALCLIAQASLASLIASGRMVDPGLFPLANQSAVIIALTQAIILSLYCIAFWLARTARDSTLRAMDDLVAARRVVHQRDAQLQEVRQELDRALVVGGAGRYTDQTLGGYRLGMLIGRGGMGEVYEASHGQTGHIAAVKLLHPNLLTNKDSVERFLREASAASAIDSPHAVKIIASADASDPLPYLIMERLHGNDLGYFLRKRGRLAPRQLIEVCQQVATVIDAASSRGIVHRDLKPQNLFLANQPNGNSIWKVLDFGASKLGHHSGTLTEGRVVGTPGYLSPEQACGEDVDGSADRYGLAAIAYRAITGRAPFVGNDLPAILFKVVHGMPPQPTSLATVPLAVDTVLAVGLAKRSGDRFETAAEFADALELAIRGGHDDWIERRAEALLADLPWGYRPKAHRPPLKP